jgi:hypothetical protein
MYIGILLQERNVIDAWMNRLKIDDKFSRKRPLVLGRKMIRQGMLKRSIPDIGHGRPVVRAA